MAVRGSVVVVVPAAEGLDPVSALLTGVGEGLF